MRRLAELAQISNPYLSQLERGLSEPSVRVLNSLAQALNLSAEVLLDQAGLLRDIRGRDLTAVHSQEPGASCSADPPWTLGRVSPPTPYSTEAAIRADDRLSAEQKRALLAVYNSYVVERPSSAAQMNGRVVDVGNFP